MPNEASLTAWERLKKGFVKLFYGLCLFTLLLWMPSVYKHVVDTKLILPAATRTLTDIGDPQFLVKTPTCKIYRLDPFGKDAKGYIKIPKPRECEPVIVYADGELLKFNTTHENYEYAKCCYLEVYRKSQSLSKFNSDADHSLRFTKRCRPMNKSTGGLHFPSEVVRVICKITRDSNTTRVKYHFVKPLSLAAHSNETAAKLRYWRSQLGSGAPLPPSVVIIGIDSVSRNHLLRSMPTTLELLEQHDFVDIQGYTKVGKNTFPNAMAFLGGMYADKQKWPCWLPKQYPMDVCPLIWQSFNENRYVTAFLEDAHGMAIFNYYKLGFVQQPTDYYSRIMGLAYTGGAWYGGSYHGCVGGLTENQLLLKYVRDVVHVAKEVPFFLFSWFTSLAHDDFNMLKHTETEFRDLLQAILGGTKNSSHEPVVIFMSDHGSTVGYFRTSILGHHEDALPFLFIRLPPSLRSSHPVWYENLQTNSRRLTSPFDLHATLEHLVSLSQNDVKYQKERSSTSDKWSYSLFEEIPTNRTCESAKIPHEFCRCGVNPKVSRKSKLSKQFMLEVGRTVNIYVDAEIKRNVCVPMKAKSVQYLREIGHGEVWNNMGKLVPYEEYLLGMEMQASGAKFEAVVRRMQNGTTVVVGEVSRTSLYKGQSDCVNDSRLKNYCMCWEFYEQYLERERRKKERREMWRRMKRLKLLRKGKQ